jgi:hypothetical protein
LKWVVDTLVAVGAQLHSIRDTLSEKGAVVLVTIKINLRDDGTFVPPGRYKVEVEAVTLRDSAAGSQYLSLRLRILEGAQEGSKLWGIASLRSDMRGLLRSMLRALGVDEDTLDIEVEEVGDESVVVEPMLDGRRAIAEVVHKEYMGETQAKVRRLIAEEVGS